MLYTFPDPRADAQARLVEAKPAYFPTATISTSFPDVEKGQAVDGPHIQHAWDGTPSQERQRELATIRVTVWTPKGQVSAGIDLASLVQAILLDGGSANVWRYLPSTGRLVGIDDDTGLPFCTFTLTAETRPSPVA